jgi:hypothetical protein
MPKRQEVPGIKMQIKNKGHGHGRHKYGISGKAPLTPDQRFQIIDALIRKYPGLCDELLDIELQRND